MNKAHNITFNKLMASGYISEDTYIMLLPKKQFHELLFHDCYLYNEKIRNELTKLFEDEHIAISIYLLERLEKDLSNGNNTPFAILEECLSNYDAKTVDIVNNIGIKTFLLDYVFSTEETLKTRYLIDKSNYSEILSLVNQFRSLYKDYCEGTSSSTDLPINDYEIIKNLKNAHESKAEVDVVEEKKEIKSGEGFTKFDIISIDDDSLSPANANCEKYVAFLYSLDKNDLIPIVTYLKSQIGTSVRVLNCLKSVGFKNYLVNYLYADSTKLLNIRNLGKKTLLDLEKTKPALFEYIKKMYEESDTTEFEKDLENEKKSQQTIRKTLRDRLGETQYSMLYRKLILLTKTISVRSRNGIVNYKGDFIEDFVNLGMDIKTINHIGKKSESEIIVIVEKLKKIAETMDGHEMTGDELFIAEKQSFYDYCFDYYAQDYYLKNGHLPMFYIFEKFIRKKLKNNRDYQILNFLSPLFKDEDYYTSEEIASKVDLSRERIRQIYVKTKKQFNGSFNSQKSENGISLSKFFVNNNDWDYIKNKFAHNSYLDVSCAREISALETNSFTDLFVLLIINHITQGEFELVGKEPIPPFTRWFKTSWNNCYLIKKELTDKFDFNKIFQLIADFESSSTEDIVVSIREMLLGIFLEAWKEFDSNIVDELSEVVATILIKELGIIPDINFNFTIEGKKEENVADILYDILKTNGNPLSYEELYLAIDERYPNKYKSPASIRAVVMKDPRLCNVGVNNLVGLLEWNHIIIGSIRDIIAQYLAKFNEPQHISEIARYVQRYRDTTERSIRNTMISGEQFVQFSGGLFGLKDKQYSDVFYLDESDRIFGQRIQELELFLQEKKHFPFVPSTNSQEESLYRWWNKNKKSNKLKEHQKSEIERIKSVYKALPYSKRNYEWFKLCKEYHDFVQKNNRRPSRRNEKEQYLCAWFDKAYIEFTEGNMNSTQEASFIELCKSL